MPVYDQEPLVANPLRQAIYAPPPTPRPGSPSPGAPPPGSAPPGGAPPGLPDYLALLRQSPAYQAWLASRNNRLGNLATDRKTAIQQLALMFGGLPPGFKDAFGDLSPEDLAAAGGNQFSVTAQLQRGDAQSREAMRRSLAARGMLQSGELGYGSGQADLALAQGENDAATQFLGQLNAAISSYGQGAGAVNAEESGLIAQLMPQITALYPAPAPGAPGAPGAPPAVPGVPVTPVPSPPPAPRPANPPLRTAQPAPYRLPVLPVGRRP